MSARSDGNFEISQSCFFGGSTGNVANSDGSGSTVVEEETNFVDLEAYTLSGSQCTTEEEGLLSSTSCLPFATSEVCVLQVVDSEAPSLTPSVLPSAADGSASPTALDASASPTALDASASPTVVEVEISAFPSDFPSGFPSASLEPSFIPSKPPVFRPDCPEGDDDDDDEDDGKGKGKGKGAKKDRNCRRKHYKRKKREKLFESKKGSKLSKDSKSGKQDKSKSEKSDKSSSESSSNDIRHGGKGRWWISK